MVNCKTYITLFGVAFSVVGGTSSVTVLLYIRQSPVLHVLSPQGCGEVGVGGWALSAATLSVTKGLIIEFHLFLLGGLEPG